MNAPPLVFKSTDQKQSLWFFLIAAVITLSGCANTQEYKTLVDNSDPWEKTNRKIYNFNDALDRRILVPVAETYAEYTPLRVRDSVDNFFSNIDYSKVMLNNFLQGNLRKTASDATRLFFNVTIGIGGLFDASTAMGLPKHRADVGQTLARWGVRQGPYLQLPLFGPNTARGSGDIALSSAITSFIPLAFPVMLPINLLETVNRRASLLEATKLRDQAAVDPYTFTREAYLQSRAALIYSEEQKRQSSEEEMQQMFDDFFAEEDEGILLLE